jgi:hypothetical protein
MWTCTQLGSYLGGPARTEEGLFEIPAASTDSDGHNEWRQLTRLSLLAPAAAISRITAPPIVVIDRAGPANLELR